jgi:3-oxoadipate enol-lactonase
MVAQEVVMRRPDLVHRLVLSGTTSQADAAWSDDAVAQCQQLDSTASGDMALLSQTVVDAQVGPLALPEGVQLARYCMAQLSPVTYRLALQAQANFDREAALGHIHVPTLLLTGEHDRKAPAATLQRMAAQIAGSRWVQLPGIGHLQNLEAPDAFDALVLDFLREPQATRLH